MIRFAQSMPLQTFTIVCHKGGHILFFPLLILNIKGCRTSQLQLSKLSLIWTIQSLDALASAWSAPYAPKPRRDHVSPR